MSVAEYASISLNIPTYPWRCLNSCSNYASALNMPDRHTCITGFWRFLGLKICQGSEYGTDVNARVTQSSQYIWLWLHTPQYSLNMSKYRWILLNVPEYAGIKCSYYNTVLKVLRYSYNNIIIIVANVAMLELLSARFIHPGTLLPFHIFRT